MISRFLAIAAFSIVLSVLLVNLNARSLDMFFLDWKQLIANPKGPQVDHFRILDLSLLKKNAGVNGEPLEERILLDVIAQVSSVAPKAIILAMSPREIEFAPGQRGFSEEISSIPNVYVLTNTTVFKEDSFKYDQTAVGQPKPLFLTLTHDTQIDLVSRRILTFYDVTKQSPSKDYLEIQRITDVETLPSFFEYDFEYLETSQVYMKIWPYHKFGETTLSSKKLDDEILNSLKNKVVILGTSGKFSFTSQPSIIRRLNIFGEDRMERNYWPGSYLLATYMANFTNRDYVRHPTQTMSYLWTSFWVILFLMSLVFLPVKKAFGVSSGVLFLYLVVGLVIFRVASLNFDVGRFLILGIVSQYIILPIRFIRHIRLLDEEKFQRQKDIFEAKLRGRALVKAASLEAVLRTVGKVSHDIRSPLMALQIATSLAKNNLTEELKDLFDNSLQRMRDISEDLLVSYKNRSLSGIDDVNLKNVLEELLLSYRAIYSQVIFELDVAADVIVYWPVNSMQRTFSNLINNSIEACSGRADIIRINITTHIQDEYFRILITDNGPGVSAEFRNRLFNERATFNKSSGTGLGLFQARQDLEMIGGRIRYLDVEGVGACFEIIIPKSLNEVMLSVSTQIVVVGGDATLIRRFEELERTRECKVHYLRDFKEFKDYLNNKYDGNRFTLIGSLLVPGEEETGLDLLDLCQNVKTYKSILFTDLASNSEIAGLVNNSGALLMPRYFIEKMKVVVSKMDN